MVRPNILVNLPPGFYATPVSKRVLRRLDALGTVRRRSWNKPEEIAKDLAWAQAVVMWSWPVFSDEMLDRATGLRYLGTIDILRQAAQRYALRGIPISTSRRCWSPAGAEMALTLTLSLLRQVSGYHAAMRAGTEAWVASLPDGIDPLERELSGRPVGIIGFGAVGRRYAELLAPFHCPIAVYDPFLPPGVAEAAGARPMELHDLLRASEVVTLCAASNQGTAKLLGAKEIRLLRPHAVLVNVARAALVETPALVARLKKGDLIAAIDVFDQEPLAKSSPLRSLANAFLTPHRAGGVMSSIERALTMLVDDLEAVEASRPRRWALTETMLPGLDG